LWDEARWNERREWAKTRVVGTDLPAQFDALSL
jgi:hypothetical protein